MKLPLSCRTLDVIKEQVKTQCGNTKVLGKLQTDKFYLQPYTCTYTQTHISIHYTYDMYICIYKYNSYVEQLYKQWILMNFWMANMKN